MVRPVVSACDLRVLPITQLGLLRLLTAKTVMGDEVMTQPRAWAV
jgi:hypothetical protein